MSTAKSIAVGHVYTSVDSIIAELEKFSFYPQSVENIKIKNAVLESHNTLESLLHLIISNYYFGKNKETQVKANHFWINILVNMTFDKKIKLCIELKPQLKEIENILTNINALRNDMAHYPNRVFKRQRNHLCYDQKPIYTDFDALKKFRSDFEKVYFSLAENK